MKDWLIIICVAVIAILGVREYQRWTAAPVAPPAQVLSFDASPASPPATSLFATPAPRPVAVGDSVYLLHYAGAWSPKGVFGLEPGKRVRIVALDAAKATLRVADDEHHEADVRIDAVIADPDLAEAAGRQDAASQTRITAYQEAQRRELRARLLSKNASPGGTAAAGINPPAAAASAVAQNVPAVQNTQRPDFAALLDTYKRERSPEVASR